MASHQIGWRRFAHVSALVILVSVTATASLAGVPVMDGSCVLTDGRLHLNVTNWGLLGSRFSIPSTFSHSPSAQWPGGTSHEYLHSAGIWVGARHNGQINVSCSQPASEFAPPTTPDGVMYEARNGQILRPRVNPAVTGIPGDRPGGDDDGDGLVDEEVLDGRDQDGDGRIDEDFAQRGSQMFSCLMVDDTPLLRSLYPDHQPLGLRIHQEVCAWDSESHENIVGLRYTITNISNVDLQDVYVGLFIDSDIGRHDDQGVGENDLAGCFQGRVRQTEGYFADLDYAWMRDGDPDQALPGWLTVTMEGRGLGDSLAVRPAQYSLHSMRVVDMLAGGMGLGLAVSDAERYMLMAEPGIDPEVPAFRTGAYALLLTAGPYEELAPGEFVVIQAALTMAAGHNDIQLKVRRAQEASDGRWWDRDGRSWSGGDGTDSIICAEDYHPVWDAPDNPVYDHYLGYWQTECMPPGLLIPRLQPGQFAWHPFFQKHCAWINTDNCDECERYHGVGNCFPDGPNRQADCNDSVRGDGACTGTGGREARLPFTGTVDLPRSPWLRTVPRDCAVEIFWDDRSEQNPDDVADALAFESYRIWRSDHWSREAGTSEATGPPADSWALRAEFDLVSYGQADAGDFTVPLGRNTGLEPVHYRPTCLDDPDFAGLADAMNEIVMADTQGLLAERPRLRGLDGGVFPEYAALLPWEDEPAVLDTFFALAERPATAGVPKRGVRYYHYRDEGLHNGFIYFYSVTATGIMGDPPRSSGRLPSGAFTLAIPRTAAQADHGAPENIYVFPNPATREALEEFQAMAPSKHDPTGVRIAFANLPRCRSSIQIFSLAGDLIVSLDHDGADGNGQAYWNLMSRNGQEIVSGIYLYVVEPRDHAYERTIGKFVVVR